MITNINMNSIFKSIDNFKKYKNVSSSLIKGDENVLETSEITVVMPIFNHHRFLKDSICSALKQKTTRKYSILIVDNDSEQKYGNQEIVSAIDDNKIVYYRNEENLGAAGNWNRCVELSKSKYITYLHDDDMLKEDTIETLFIVKEISKADFVFSCFEKVNEKGQCIHKEMYVPSYRPVNLEHMLINNYCQTGEAALLNREIIIQLGGFSEEYRPCFDYAFFTHVVYKYNTVKYLKPLLDYRVAENDTLSCYKEIPFMDDFVRKSIIERLNYPKKLMFKYNEVVLKVQNNQINNVFGGQNNGRYDNVNIFERILFGVLHKAIKYISSYKSEICYITSKEIGK